MLEEVKKNVNVREQFDSVILGPILSTSKGLA